MGRLMRGPFRHPSPKIGLVNGASFQPRQNLMVNLRLKDYGGDQKKLDAAMRYLLWFSPKLRIAGATGRLGGRGYGCAVRAEEIY
jgi:hypothetical protein